MATVAPQIQSPVLREADSASSVQEAWTSSGLVSGTSATIIAPREGPEPSTESIEEAYVPVAFARQHLETMQQCMTTMQHQTSSHIQEIERQYATIEEDTDSRFNELVTELKKRGGLMKDHYRGQLGEAHDQLEMTRTAAETVEQKNLALAVTNVDLLRTVDSLEQVRLIQEEELERMSIKYEETMVEQGKKEGKSAVELKKIREEATKERISTRMKYGARITAVMAEESGKRVELVDSHDMTLAKEQQKAAELLKELTVLQEAHEALEQTDKEKVEEMNLEMVALKQQVADDELLKKEAAKAASEAAQQKEWFDSEQMALKSSNAATAQMEQQLQQLEAQLADSKATAEQLQKELNEKETKVEYVSGPKPSDQIKDMNKGAAREMPEELDMAAVAAVPAEEGDDEDALRNKLKDSVGRNEQLQVQLNKLQDVLRDRDDRLLEEQAKLAAAATAAPPADALGAPPSIPTHLQGEEEEAEVAPKSAAASDWFDEKLHEDKVAQIKYEKAQDQLEDLQEQTNESYAELQSLTDQLQEAELKIEQLETELEDAKPPPTQVASLEELVEKDDDGNAASELDKGVTLQFQILQDQLEREKAARQRAEDSTEEAKLAAEKARDAEANWHMQVKENAEEIAITRVRCTDLQGELALARKAKDDAIAETEREKSNTLSQDVIQSQLQQIQEITGDDDQVEKLKGVIKYMEEQKQKDTEEMAAARKEMLSAHTKEVEALTAQARKSLEEEKSVLMAAAETEVESMKAAAEEVKPPEDTRNYEEELTALQQLLDSTVSQLTTQLGDKDAELAGVLAEKESVGGATDEETARKEKEWHNKVQDITTRFETQIGELTTQINEKDDALSRLKDSMEALKDSDKAQASVDELQAELVRQGAELDDAQIKLGGALRDANSMETRTEQVESELETLQEQMGFKVKELNQLKGALSASQASLKKATQAADRGANSAKAKQEAANKRAMEKAARKRELELRRLNRETAQLRSKVRDLERSGRAGGGGGGVRALSSARPTSPGGGGSKEQEKQIADQRRELRKMEQEMSKLQQKGGDAALATQAKKLETAHRREIDKMKKEYEKKAKAGAGAKNERAMEKAVKSLEAANTELDDLRKLPKQLASKEKEIKELTEATGKMTETLAELKTCQDSLVATTAEKGELETMYRNEALLRKQLHNQLEDLKGKIRVYCRCRPMKKNEIDLGSNVCVTFPDQYTVSVYNQNKEQTKTWQFDACFPPSVGQEAVFEETEMLVQSAIDGFNVAVFAYGQTGSGKTWTMCGPPDNPGLAPRSMQHLFLKLEEQQGALKCEITSYMLEIYMDELIDLYLPKKAKNRPKMSIMQGEKGIVEVKNCTSVKVESLEHLAQLFEDGQKNRHVTKTKMNDESSRSHLVFAMCLKVTNTTSGKISRGKLSLIDLAGSERLSKTGATGQAAKEGAAINMSLSALGNVIAALSSGEKVVPYRGSALTELMRDSLGGNAKTLMFVNISPADYNCDETLQALLYAARVKMITNDANAAAESAELDELKNYIKQLKAFVSESDLASLKKAKKAKKGEDDGADAEE